MGKPVVHRTNTLLPALSGKPTFGTAYTVTAYRHGAIANAASASTTVTVHANHGFKINDKLMLGLAPSSMRIVTAYTNTTLTVNSALSVADEDVLINLGPDTGAGTPNYDGSPLSTYTDNNGDGANTSARVTADSQGVYAYWHDGREEIWELIRDSSGTPVGVIKGVASNERRTVFNVKDYGARGDGSNDDTDAIQLAINDAADVGGCKVLIPDGTYIVSKQTSSACLDLTGKHGITIEGESRYGTIVKLAADQTATCHMFQCGLPVGSDTTYGITIRNLTIDGNNANQSGVTSSNSQQYPIIFSNAHQVIIDSVFCKDGGFAGIYIFHSSGDTVEKGCRDVVIRDCRVTGSTNQGILLTGGENVRCLSNYIFDTGTVGIKTEDARVCRNLVISGNIIEECDSGILIQGDGDTSNSLGASSSTPANRKHTGGTSGPGTPGVPVVLTDSGATFTTNYLVGSRIYNDTDGSSGIVTSNTGTTVSCAELVGGTDNSWELNDQYSIGFDVQNIVIADNIIQNINQTSDTSFGIGVQTCRGVTIKGNTLDNCYLRGISLMDDVREAVIMGNVVYQTQDKTGDAMDANDRRHAIGGYPFASEVAPRDVTIIGNIITENEVRGISFFGITTGSVPTCENIHIIGNVLRNNGTLSSAAGGGEEVFIQSFRNLVFNGNSIYQNGDQYWIRITESGAATNNENLIVANNIFYNTTGDGDTPTRTVLFFGAAQSGSFTLDDLVFTGNHCPANVAHSNSTTLIGGNIVMDNNIGGTAVVMANERSLAGKETTFSANDTTPDVSGGVRFVTANASGTVVTTFDGGVAGQEIWVRVNDANTTFDFSGTTLKGNGGSDRVAASGDTLHCIYDGTNWHCTVSFVS